MRFVRSTAASTSSSRHKHTGTPATMRGAARPADAAAVVMIGRDVLADRPFVGHPQDRAVGALTRQPQHHGPQRGEQHGRRRDVGDVERVVHAERVVLDVDRSGAGEGPVEHVEMGAHRRDRMLVRQAEHLVDDPVVGHAETQSQPAIAHRLHRQRLLRERDRMPRLDGYDRGADLDAVRLDADDRGRGERVEVVGDLRDPDRRQAGVLGPARIRRAAVRPSCRTGRARVRPSRRCA